MKTRLLGIIGIRVVAVYLLVRAFNFVTHLPLLFQGRVDRAAVLQVIMLIALPFVFTLAVGVFLWITADRMAGYIIPGSYAEATIPGLSDRGLAATAFTVLGAIVLAFAVPGLFHNVTNWLLVKWWRLDLTYTLGNAADAVRNTVQFIIGLVLVLKGRGFAERLHGHSPGNGEPGAKDDERM